MSTYENFTPIDLENIHTYELASRPSKVTVADFASSVAENDSLREFLDKLPKILAVESLREIAAQMKRARDLSKPIVWGIGGHVVKTGLLPIIIDLVDAFCFDQCKIETRLTISLKWSRERAVFRREP